MKHMKKIQLLILALFIGFSAFGQQTYFTTPPPSTTSLIGLQYRYKAIVPDSLNELYMFWNGKYNQVYTATESNLRFAPIAGGGYVPNSRLVSTNAGTFLFGGGNLGSNLSLYNDTAGLTTKNFFNTRIGTRTQDSITKKLNRSDTIGNSGYVTRLRLNTTIPTVTAAAVALKEDKANKAIDFSIKNNNLYPTTLATSNYVSGFADTATSVKSNRLGLVVNPTFTAATSTQYDDVTPTTTVTWNTGYVQGAGGDGTTANYVAYKYYTNSMYNGTAIEFVPTSSGSGIAPGYNGANANIVAKITLTGGSNGVLTIQKGATVLATSAASLSYSNGDTIRVEFFENLNTYIARAYLKNTPNNVAYVTYANDKVIGTSATNNRASQPAIYFFGGTQRVTKHEVYINDIVTPDLTFIGNSIASGSYSQGTYNMWTNNIKLAATGSTVNIIAGSGNRTSDYVLLRKQIWSEKPRMAVFALGINDIISSIPTDTIKARTRLFIADAYRNGSIPIVATILPVSSSYSSGGLTNTQIRDTIAFMNTWIATLRVNQLDIYSAIASSGVLPSIYDSGDGLHPNGLGHRAIAGYGMDQLKELINIKQTLSASINQFISTIENTKGIASWRVLSGTNSGFTSTYPSDDATVERRGKTVYGNIGGGAALVAGTASTPAEILSGGTSFTTNKIASFSLDSIGFYNMLKAVLNYSTNGTTKFSVVNLNTGSSQAASFEAISNNARGFFGAFGSGRGSRSGYTVAQAITGTGLGLISPTKTIFVNNATSDFTDPVAEFSNAAGAVFYKPVTLPSASILATPASGVITNLTGTCTSCNIGGNSATVTNGVYTTTFNGLGDARYGQLSVNNTWTGDHTWNNKTVKIYETGTVSDAMGANNVTLANNGTVKAAFGISSYLGTAIGIGMNTSTNDLAIGGGSGRNIGAVITNVSFTHNISSGATYIYNSSGTQLFGVNNLGYMKSVLPAYASGTFFPTVYNSTNDRYENGSTLIPALSAANNFTQSQTFSGSVLNLTGAGGIMALRWFDGVNQINLQPSSYTGTINHYLPSTSGTLSTQQTSTQITSGIVAPSSTPTKIGDMFIDTVLKKVYVSTGTTSSADWTLLN